MHKIGAVEAKWTFLAISLIYFFMVAAFLLFGEHCYEFARASYCDYPCEHGCELALGMLKHGEFVSIHYPDRIWTGWPPGYAFFVLPFLWASDGVSLLGAVIFQAGLVFAVSLMLRRAVDNLLPGFGLLMMALYLFNPNVFGLLLLAKTDTIFSLCLAVAFIWLLDYLKDNQGGRVVLVGGLIGVAILIRPSAQFLILLLPLLTVLLAWVRPQSGGSFRALGHGLGGSALSVCVVIPWMIFVNQQGEGYRLASQSTEYTFLSDNIGTLDAHLAGRSMNDRLSVEYTAKIEAELSASIANWNELGDADKYRERVRLARRDLFSYPPGDYVYPALRSVARFFVTGGEGYLLEMFGFPATGFGAGEKQFEGGAALTITATEVVAKGYAVVVRLLGLLGIVWLVRQRQFGVLVLCLAPTMYFLFLHLLEGWSRFRLPVEAPLALLGVFGVVYLLDMRNRSKPTTEPTA